MKIRTFKAVFFLDIFGCRVILFRELPEGISAFHNMCGWAMALYFTGGPGGIYGGPLLRDLEFFPGDNKALIPDVVCHRDTPDTGTISLGDG